MREWVASAPNDAPARTWGILAVAFYAIHGGYHILDHHPEHLLWACHLATVLVGLGFLCRAPALNGIGFLWLLVGNLLWIIDLANGAPLLPTSLFPHVGGFALSVYGLRSLGLPRGTWWKAVMGYVLLQQLCRWFTPPQSNVNISFAVWAGWDGVFPSYLWFALLTESAGALSYFLIERAVLRPRQLRARASESATSC